MSNGGIVLLATAVLLVLWGIGAHNRLVRLRSALTQAWAPLDAQISRRHALALEIVAVLDAPQAEEPAGDEIVRAALQTLDAAARQAVAATAHARLRASAAGALQSLSLAEQVLSGALRPVPVLIDAAGGATEETGFLGRTEDLWRRLQEIQAQTRFVRVAFNDAVGAYNAAIDEMPTRLLAGPFGFRPAAALQVQDVEMRPPDLTDPAAPRTAGP